MSMLVQIRLARMYASWVSTEFVKKFPRAKKRDTDLDGLACARPLMW